MKTLDGEALPTPTRIARLGVVKYKATAVKPPLMVQGYIAQVDGGFPVEENPESIEIDDRVPLSCIGELELIAQPGAASALNPQPEARLAFEFDQPADLLPRRVGQRDDRIGRRGGLTRAGQRPVGRH